MKSRTWLLLFACILLVCAGLSFWLLTGAPASRAEIYQDGNLVRTVDLSVDQTFTITRGMSSNTITVSGGKIAVTRATCPDRYCVEKGYQNSGAPIVCLPNRLVISFPSGDDLDAIVG